MANPEDIYATDPPLKDEIEALGASVNPPKTPSKPSYGIDSPLGAVGSLITAPLYLYATLRGKHQAWDALLSATSVKSLLGPTIDFGCGRGMVLLKVAALKKTHGSNAKAYGIDIFNANDQSGNSAEATYSNAASLGLLQHVALHEASFTTTLPFKDNAFTLVTSSLAIHNVSKDGRAKAIEEMARVCKPGGKIIILELAGYVGDYKDVLVRLGWKNVKCEMAGLGATFGFWPCQTLTATKPSED